MEKSQDPPKKCDHTSVGLLVWKEGKLLLIERARFPFGFAVPAGHIDGDSSAEEAAKRELKEETGLEAGDLELVLEARMDNRCRREGGNWHQWKLYEAEAAGELKRSEDETKQAGWHSSGDIKILAERTEAYLADKISEAEWLENPGLEPVMNEFFKQLKIV